mmetsp:Transcript_58045/g.127214  ORF Transcript_58045/g.127214 Transcript_58045/m.127214 type:complete len:217 (-) Transcript_58045:35-685(-)
MLGWRRQRWAQNGQAALPQAPREHPDPGSARPAPTPPHQPHQVLPRTPLPPRCSQPPLFLAKHQIRGPGVAVLARHHDVPPQDWRSRQIRAPAAGLRDFAVCPTVDRHESLHRSNLPSLLIIATQAWRFSAASMHKSTEQPFRPLRARTPDCTATIIYIPSPEATLDQTDQRSLSVVHVARTGTAKFAEPTAIADGTEHTPRLTHAALIPAVHSTT